MNTNTGVYHLKKQHDELLNLINVMSIHPVNISNQITIGESTLHNPTLCQIWDAINNVLIGSPYENKCGYYGVLGIIKAILKDVLYYENLCNCEFEELIHDFKNLSIDFAKCDMKHVNQTVITVINFANNLF